MAKSTMLTKTGKTRLGPLNIAQLTDLLAKSSKPKDKAKIERALVARKKTQAVSTKVVAQEVETTVQLEQVAE
jgi:hypothetical protein